jgi:hydrogenase expression/formation protein HypC
VKVAHLLYLPEARVGDWVLVQSGFVTSRLEESEAREALGYLQEAAGASPASPSPTGLPAANMAPGHVPAGHGQSGGG